MNFIKTIPIFGVLHNPIPAFCSRAQEWIGLSLTTNYSCAVFNFTGVRWQGKKFPINLSVHGFAMDILTDDRDAQGAKTAVVETDSPCSCMSKPVIGRLSAPAVVSNSTWVSMHQHGCQFTWLRPVYLWTTFNEFPATYSSCGEIVTSFFLNLRPTVLRNARRHGQQYLMKIHDRGISQYEFTITSVNVSNLTVIFTILPSNSYWIDST